MRQTTIGDFTSAMINCGSPRRDDADNSLFESIDKYKEADGDCCPYCGSKKIQNQTNTLVGNFTVSSVFCSGCQTSYKEWGRVIKTTDSLEDCEGNMVKVIKDDA